jgi:hypothetical protein
MLLVMWLLVVVVVSFVAMMVVLRATIGKRIKSTLAGGIGCIQVNGISRYTP